MIWTSDLTVPNRALYQAEPRPVIFDFQSLSYWFDLVKLKAKTISNMRFQITNYEWGNYILICN